MDRIFIERVVRWGCIGSMLAAPMMFGACIARTTSLTDAFVNDGQDASPVDQDTSPVDMAGDASPGVAAAQFSQIVSLDHVRADGIEAATIQIILRDGENSPVVGVQPTFSASGTGNIYVASCGPTDGRGVTTCTNALASTTAETKVLSIMTPVVKSGGSIDFAPPWIFRSVGPNQGSPLASEIEGRVVIADGRATFDVALPHHVGVGDVLLYESSGGGVPDTVAFIHARRGSSQFDVRNAEGLAPKPAETSIWALHRAHVSLNDAVNRRVNESVVNVIGNIDEWLGETGDLTTARRVWAIACYGDAPDRHPVRFGAWVTSATTPVRIFTPVAAEEVGDSQRHPGHWDVTRYHLDVDLTGDYAYVIRVLADHVHIEGLQIVGRGGGKIETGGISIPYTQGPKVDVRFSNNIIRGALDQCAGGGWGMSGGPGIARIYNNVVYDWACGSQRFHCIYAHLARSAFVYNNTLAGCYHGISGPYAPEAPRPLLILKNNIAIGNQEGDYQWYSSSESSHNASSDGSAPAQGAIRLSSQSLTDYFVSSEDFRVNPAAAHHHELVDRGVDLTEDEWIDLRVDMRDESRPQGAGFDLGAFELTR